LNLALGQFEKRERPKVIADGHRDAIIDCLYKNTNTGDVCIIWKKKIFVFLEKKNIII
jgi:hypothetical protein